jgi:MtfA peptidase
MKWYARWRQARTLKRRAIPDTLWHLTLAQFPFLTKRAPAELESLRQLCTLFLADKEFAGMQGLHVDDAMAVAIAAQACLPILAMGLHWYDGFKGIVVHPDVVMARREVMDEDGVVHHYDEELSGEAMQGGPVMLSWRDVADAGESAEWGYNVVIHEFVHVLDQRGAWLDTGPEHVEQSNRQQWRQAIVREYESFCREVDSGEATLVDPYGAESLEEFLAVSAEAFFVAPAELMAERPELYALLRICFKQDPNAEARQATTA